MFKNNGSFWDLPESIYKWMKEEKIIHPNKKDVENAMNYARERLKRDSAKNTMESIIQRSVKVDIKNVEERTQRYCREYIVCQAFENTEISELIKLIKINYFQ
jgi:hypothetical protein